MTSEDDEETRIRRWLHHRITGPAPTPTVSKTAVDTHVGRKPRPEDGWWDQLYADEKPTEPEALAEAPDPPWWSLRKRTLRGAEAEPEPTPAGQKGVDEDEPDVEPQPASQRPGGNTQSTRGARSGKAARRGQHPATAADPRRSLIEAWDAVPYRVRRLMANGAAAGLGWSIGLVDFTQDICAWVHAHGPADAQSIFWFCVGAACLVLRGHARGHSPPVVWLATVPVASAVLGVLLYAPNT